MLVKIKDNIVIGFASSDETPEEGVTIVNGDNQNFSIGWSYDFETKKFHKSFNNIREQRDQLLKDSDYTQLPDSTYPSTQDAWKTYRQQLRDITKGVTDPDTIVFPEEPK
tara:strand:- start:7634 stop:7963 length:330 start_codon:yes stop_codon:yes gene_type:complete